MADLTKPWTRPDYWEAHFRESFTPWDLDEPSPTLIKLLEEKVPLVENQAVFVPGAGYGHDAIYFAQKGHRVSAVDWSDIAVNDVRARAKREKVPMEVLRSDFWKIPEAWRGTFDVWFEHTFLCAIDPGDHQRYAEQVLKLLKPDGIFLGVLFVSNEFKDRAIFEDQSPPFWIKEEEIRALFEPHFKIELLEPSPYSPERRAIHEWWTVLKRKS